MTWLFKGLLITALFVGLVLGLGALIDAPSQASSASRDASVSGDASSLSRDK